MKKYGKKGFTLIELIAVLVIMAIIALIATPLVMNIIRKSKISARKRSVDAYGRSVELAIASYLLDTGTFPTDLHSLTIEYSGNTVVCNVMQMKENGGLYMSECSVNNVEVKDNSTEDGWYHYGTRDLTNEEYVDMYGKNVEAALKLYHDTNNAYPEAIDTLTIESVGKTVACESSINYDGTVYLTNCKVDGVSVVDTNQEDGYYHYGRVLYKKYSIGDTVNYNDMNFYVIKESDENTNYVTLLKAEPFSKSEVDYYGVGHVNVYDSSHNDNGSQGEAYENGGVAYYSSQNCRRSGVDDVGYEVYIINGCKTDYLTSDVKFIVDAWTSEKINEFDLVVDSTGYNSRLITVEELVGLGYIYNTNVYSPNSSVPSWVYNNSYSYWTMSSYDSTNVFFQNSNRYSANPSVSITKCSVGKVQNGVGRGTKVFEILLRPVITIKKSAL